MRAFVWHEGDSFLHGLNPLTKLLMCFLAAAVVSTANEPITPALVILLSFAVTRALGARAVASSRPTDAVRRAGRVRRVLDLHPVLRWQWTSLGLRRDDGDPTPGHHVGVADVRAHDRSIAVRALADSPGARVAAYCVRRVCRVSLSCRCSKWSSTAFARRTRCGVVSDAGRCSIRFVRCSATRFR